MTRALLALALAVGVITSSDIIQGQPPPAGAVQGKADVLAFATDTVLASYADAGRPFTQSGHYVQFTVRAWYDPTTGTVGLPNLPAGLYPLRARKAATTCTDPVLCDPAAPGVLQVAEVPLDCACSSGTQCRVANPDGGVFPDGGPTPVPAPTGVTIPSGTFQGAGCVAKACIQLWHDNAGDDTWPAGCPQ